MRLPRHTRLILIPEDEAPSREYLVSRGAVLGLVAVALLIVASVVLLMVSYLGLVGESRRLQPIQRELAEARGRMSRLQALSDELEDMRSFQERLLVILGVEGSPVSDQDTLCGAVSFGAPEPVGALERAANVVMTPPPDLWPVQGYVTREFREGETARGVLPHHGVDLVAPLSSPVRAAGRGRVSQAGWDDFLGNYVEIQHGFGYVTVYGHCMRLAVVKGDRVDRGQVIGYLGGTGQASAPHLHFEVWKEGVAVDPGQVLPENRPR